MARHIILNFHGIGQPARALEANEAPYWVSEDFFAEALHLVDRLADRVQTHFNFDDGNLSDIEHGARLLEEHGRRATFFVLADRIDTPGSLGADHLRALMAQGHRIGSHGARHVDWRALDAAGRHYEFAEARAKISAVIGRPVEEAAIPFGLYNRAVLRGLSAAGFARIYCSDKGFWQSDAAPIPRTSPTADMTLADLEAMLTAAPTVLTRGKRAFKRTIKRLR